MNTFREDISKTSSRRLEDVWRKYSDMFEHIRLQKDVLKTSRKRLLKTKTKRSFQDISTKTNDFWISSVFIRDIHAKLGILNSPKSQDIGQNSGEGIFNFWISRQSLFRQKLSKLRTSSNSKWNLDQKLDRRNTARPRNFNDQSISTNYDTLFFSSLFPI